jgi:carbon monoxide dehydrogenase subunit G
MATLHKDIFIATSPEQVWDAVRDVGALHTRLVPGFVQDTVVEDDGDARTVTFMNGLVVREAILSLDDERRRIAWTAEGAGATHYNAVLTVEPSDSGSHVLWTTDFLPNSKHESIAAMQDQALRAMKRALETDAAP